MTNREIQSWREAYVYDIITEMIKSDAYPIYEVRYATRDEDSCGIDLIIDTPLGECLIQVLAGDRKRWLQRYYGFPGIIIVIYSYNAKRSKRRPSRKSVKEKVAKHLKAWICNRPPYSSDVAYKRIQMETVDTDA